MISSSTLLDGVSVDVDVGVGGSSLGRDSISTVSEITMPSPFSLSAVVIVVTTRSLDGILAGLDD